jgi:CDP-glucose 4,6-dehydratase
VLELCGGYLTLGARLLNGLPERDQPPTDFVGCYNVGPDRTNEVAVGQLVRVAREVLGTPEYPIELGSADLHEAQYLRVDSPKVQADLGWAPRLNFDQTIRWTMGWYKRYLDSPSSAPALVDEQISDYVEGYNLERPFSGSDQVPSLRRSLENSLR